MTLTESPESVRTREVGSSEERLRLLRAPSSQRRSDTSYPTLLPTPPTDHERRLYIHRGLAPLMIASGASFAALIASQMEFVRLSPWLLLFVPPFIFSIGYYALSVLVNIGSRSFDLARHDSLVAAARSEPRPSVDVFLPICGEPAAILHNTWRHVVAMTGHYEGHVNVYVLDDSPSDQLGASVRSYGFTHISRRYRGWFKKAGNLRNGYRLSSSDLILVLDADFAPRPDMLNEMVPYFASDSRVGVVQTPQYFRVRPEQGWLERGAGAVQELFYRLSQVSRQHHEASICVGSCALYRRSALDDIGGSTLIEHSEDVHTGFDLRRRGWRLQYLPLPLATGVCPGDVDSFFTQQYRWCSGSMSLLGSTKFWNSQMRLRSRLSYLSGFCYYLHTAAFTIVGPLIPLVMLIWFPEYVALSNYLLILPSIIYNFAVFPSWHRCAYGFEAWTTKLLSGWAHAWAIWDIILDRPMGWQPTGGTARKHRTVRLWVALATWSVGTSLLWVGVAAARMISTDPVAFFPALLLGAFSLAVGLQAVLVSPSNNRRRIRAGSAAEATVGRT